MSGLAELRLAASTLEGLLWRGVARRLDMQEFGFGPDARIHTRRTGERLVPQYGVHILCPWRIERDAMVVAAASDIDSTDTIPWRHRDAILDEIFNERPLTIARSEVSRVGDLRLTLSDGTVLSTFVDRSNPDEECFRIVDVLGVHVVVYGGTRIEVVPK